MRQTTEKIINSAFFCFGVNSSCYVTNEFEDRFVVFTFRRSIDGIIDRQNC